jgi:hypothetical protein
MGFRQRNYTALDYSLKKDEVIVAYKKGSRGIILRTYNSVREIVDLEKQYNNSFSSSCVTYVLSGLRKSTRLFHLQAMAVFRVKKISEVKDALKNNE